MYIYLPNGFILFPKIGRGGCWKHCNFYKWLFSCTCQWNGCVHWFFFYISLVFLVCLVVVIVGFLFLFLVLNIEWFKKSYLWPMTFSARYYFHSTFWRSSFSLFCSVNLPEKQRLHLINEEGISLLLQIFTASTEFFIRTRSLPHLVSIT